MFSSPNPWLLATKGNGPPAASGASGTGAAPAGPVVGYHTCVGSVRDGRAGIPACAGVCRVVSTSVSDRTPTAKGPGFRKSAVVASAGQWAARTAAELERVSTRGRKEEGTAEHGPEVLTRTSVPVQA